MSWVLKFEPLISKSEAAHGLLLLDHLGWVDELWLLLLLLHGHLMLVLHLLLLHLLLLHLLWLHARVVPVHNLLLLRLHGHALERIHVLWVHEVVLDDVVIHGWHATILDKVLHGKQIEALLLKLLQVLFLLLRPEVALVDRLVAAEATRLG